MAPRWQHTLSPNLEAFLQVYDQIHIPLSLTICVFGAISNVFNIIVLTR